MQPFDPERQTFIRLNLSGRWTSDCGPNQPFPQGRLLAGFVQWVPELSKMLLEQICPHRLQVIFQQTVALHFLQPIAR